MFQIHRMTTIRFRSIHLTLFCSIWVSEIPLESSYLVCKSVWHLKLEHRKCTGLVPYLRFVAKWMVWYFYDADDTVRAIKHAALWVQGIFPQRIRFFILTTNHLPNLSDEWIILVNGKEKSRPLSKTQYTSNIINSGALYYRFDYKHKKSPFRCKIFKNNTPVLILIPPPNFFRD